MISVTLALTQQTKKTLTLYASTSYKMLKCPGLESNQHALSGTAPSRRRVYQFRHPGWVLPKQTKSIRRGHVFARDCPANSHNFSATKKGLLAAAREALSVIGIKGASPCYRITQEESCPALVDQGLRS